MSTALSETFVSLGRAASRLGVPAAWLKSEVKAGKLPHLKAGARLLVNESLVRQVLLERAVQLPDADRREVAR